MISRAHEIVLISQKKKNVSIKISISIKSYRLTFFSSFFTNDASYGREIKIIRENHLHNFVSLYHHHHHQFALVRKDEVEIRKMKIR